MDDAPGIDVDLDLDADADVPLEFITPRGVPVARIVDRDDSLYLWVHGHMTAIPMVTVMPPVRVEDQRHVMGLYMIVAARALQAN